MNELDHCIYQTVKEQLSKYPYGIVLQLGDDTVTIHKNGHHLTVDMTDGMSQLTFNYQTDMGLQFIQEYLTQRREHQMQKVLYLQKQSRIQVDNLTK